jgi:tagatose-6-phosphate ketose/aldose isomerase
MSTNGNGKSHGGEWTAREIAQQPQVWLDVKSLVAHERARLDAFLAPLLSNANLRIVFTGAGTSAYIGACLAPAVGRKLDRRVDAVATTDIVSGPARYLARTQPTLLVSFARSGGSPESLAAIELAEQAVDDVHHLIITCNAKGALAQRMSAATNACVLVLPDATHDRAFAMTSSFTGMVLAGAQAFGLLPVGRVSLLSRAAAAAMARIESLATNLASRGFERAVFLGSNELQALAAEAALKTLELTDGRVVAISESVLGFRHGPKTVVNDRTLVVVFVSNDEYARAYDFDLLRELRRDGRAGEIIAVGALRDGALLDLQVGFEGLHDATDLELVLPCVVFAQVHALKQSLAHGLTPDNPNAAGVVSRVVQGVTIHPWRVDVPRS